MIVCSRFFPCFWSSRMRLCLKIDSPGIRCSIIIFHVNIALLGCTPFSYIPRCITTWLNIITQNWWRLVNIDETVVKKYVCLIIVVIIELENIDTSFVNCFANFRSWISPKNCFQKQVWNLWLSWLSGSVIQKKGIGPDINWDSN